jgi:hypothetical protein
MSLGERAQLLPLLKPCTGKTIWHVGHSNFGILLSRVYVKKPKLKKHILEHQQL